MHYHLLDPSGVVKTLAFQDRGFNIADVNSMKIMCGPYIGGFLVRFYLAPGLWELRIVDWQNATVLFYQ